jgi:hypothetical protein
MVRRVHYHLLTETSVIDDIYIGIRLDLSQTLDPQLVVDCVYDSLMNKIVDLSGLFSRPGIRLNAGEVGSVVIVYRSFKITSDSNQEQ